MDIDLSRSDRDFDLGARRPKRIRRFGSGSAARLVVALAFAAVPFVVSTPAAFAGVGLGVIPNFPSPVSVGQTAVPASITITNLSNGPEATGNVTLTDVTLVPSCGTFSANSDCPAAGADPGVFKVSATAVGRSGTACAGITFAVTVANPATGQLSFAPSAPVVLGPPGGPSPTCVIDFNFDVLRVPTKDVSPAPGVQTEQIVAVVGFHDDGTPGSGTGTSTVTVTEHTPPLCNLTGVVAGPPKQIQITVQDTGSGLAAGGIVVTTAVNANVPVPAFTAGTTSPVVVTATKINQAAPSHVALRVTDRSGNVTTCDPTDISIDRTNGKPVTQSVHDVPSAEHFLTVFNGQPGIRTLVVNANSHIFVLRLTGGQTVTIDLGWALSTRGSNTVRFTAAGGPGSTATAVLHD
ncbi:MAG: hypothetical protein M3256_04135 [Actinomycetota bacterium]|nr:hypothetical protein [Actinomycetota bacterium]